MPRRPTFIHAWRKHRGLTQGDVVEAMAAGGFAYSVGQLSRVERGEQAYTQDLLEALGATLDAEPGALLSRSPGRDGDVMALWAGLSHHQREQLAAIGQTLLRRRQFLEVK